MGRRRMKKKSKIVKGSLEACLEASARVNKWEKHKKEGTLDQLIDYDKEWKSLTKDDNSKGTN